MSTAIKLDHDELNRIFTAAHEDHLEGRLEEAEQHYQKLLKLFPETPVLLYNLGLVYYDQKRFVLARDAFRRAADIEAGDPDIFFNLALSCHQLGDLEGAIEAGKACFSLSPDSMDILYNLSCYYRDIRQDEAAIVACEQILVRDHSHFRAMNNLAYLYHRRGDDDEAMSCYSRVLKLKPDHLGAHHMLNALRGTPAKSSPEEYIRDVFDSYSHRFEKSLVGDLEYRVPEQLRTLLEETTGKGHLFRYGIDLGCGTGLGAEPFKDMIERIDGVDLSPKMIEKAKEKKIYHSLSSGSIYEFLDGLDQKCDFLLAADVLEYIGDLRETFESAAQCSISGALFCFSTEKIESEDFRLRRSGRFGHTPGYIRRVAQETGWEVLACTVKGLRKEKGGWLDGNLWLVRRK